LGRPKELSISNFNEDIFIKTDFDSFLGYWSVGGIDYLITKGIQNSDYEDITTWSKVFSRRLRREEIVILGSLEPIDILILVYLEGKHLLSHSYE